MPALFWISLFSNLYICLTAGVVMSALFGDPAWQGAVKSFLITDDMMIPRLRWNQSTKQLEKKDDGHSLTEILQRLVLPRSAEHQPEHLTSYPLEIAGQYQTWPDLSCPPGLAEGQRSLAVHGLSDQAMESEHLARILRCKCLLCDQSIFRFNGLIQHPRLFHPQVKVDPLGW